MSLPILTQTATVDTTLPVTLSGSGPDPNTNPTYWENVKARIDWHFPEDLPAHFKLLDFHYTYSFDHGRVNLYLIEDRATTWTEITMNPTSADTPMSYDKTVTRDDLLDFVTPTQTWGRMAKAMQGHVDLVWGSFLGFDYADSHITGFSLERHYQIIMPVTIVADPDNGYAPLETSVTILTGAEDPESQFTFVWGDGTSTGPGTSTTLAHTYNDPGSYYVQVNRTGPNPDSGSCWVNVTQAPAATAIWYFGDGEQAVADRGAATHTYEVAGTFFASYQGPEGWGLVEIQATSEGPGGLTVVALPDEDLAPLDTLIIVETRGPVGLASRLGPMRAAQEHTATQDWGVYLGNEYGSAYAYSAFSYEHPDSPCDRNASKYWYQYIATGWQRMWAVSGYNVFPELGPPGTDVLIPVSEGHPYTEYRLRMECWFPGDEDLHLGPQWDDQFGPTFHANIAEPPHDYGWTTQLRNVVVKAKYTGDEEQVSWDLGDANGFLLRSKWVTPSIDGDGYRTWTFTEDSLPPAGSDDLGYPPQGAWGFLAYTDAAITFRLPFYQPIKYDAWLIGDPQISSLWMLYPPSQTIDFPQPPDTMLNEGPVALTATASSGLPITYTSATLSVCDVIPSDLDSGFVVDLIDHGTCTINADQDGGDTYLAAPRVTRSFQVTLPPGPGGLSVLAMPPEDLAPLDTLIMVYPSEG